jgi:hypothetical protein
MDSENLDEKILMELQLELRWMPGVDPRNVSVKASVEGGIATLSGHVTDPSIRRLAEKVERRVLGVRSVNNAIRIHHPSHDTRHDAGNDLAALDTSGPCPQGPD